MTLTNRTAWAILLAVVLPASFLAMAPVLGGGFLNWDDDIYVTANPLVTGFTWQGAGELFSTFHAGHYFPLTLLSYGIEYRIAGPDPGIFHLTNLLLHLIATALVFVVARSLTGSAPAALLCALLFGVHPAHAESVAWIAERKDTLYAPLFLGSLAAWLAWSRKGRGWLYLLALLLFAASLMAKAMAMTLPLVLLLVDHYERRAPTRRSLLEKAPFFLLALGSVWLTWRARLPYLAELREQPYTLADLPVSLYRLIFVHLGEILLPVGLFPLHPHRAAQLPAGLPPGLLTGAAVVVAAVALPILLAAGWRRRPWAFGPLFFAATILPVLVITAPGYFADRYTYIPSIGIFLLIALLAETLWHSSAARSPARILLALCIAAALLLLPLQARSRAAAWADGVTLWGEAIRLYPGIGDAHFLRGELLAARGELRAAVADFDAAERLDYRPGSLYEARAFAYLALGEEEAALRDLDTVLAMRPDHEAALRARALLRAREGERDR